ncbi:MAG: S-adenosylmethionine:tRNA ribosyltransferase-isomerase, partial [Phycisphaerae bacterium]|nr:S-adenosylmethionine:tRNA ribosyltransferase-isomerase [Phycisphaerae bacterium]
GRRADTGGRVEGLWLADAPGQGAGTMGGDAASLRWRVMLRGKRLRPGVAVTLDQGLGGVESTVRLRLLERDTLEIGGGVWLAEVDGARPGETTVALLERLGVTPLPPYIRAARRHAGEAESAEGERTDRAEYQTVYAHAEPTGQGSSGSVAAPTAGLHFTPELLARLADLGVGRAEVTLHVGTGTFKPVETEFVEQHPMHAEWCELPAGTCRAIGACRAAGGRVVAVGTTSARTLESFTPEQVAACARQGAPGRPLATWTRLLITPGFAWRNVDALMTNFHLPGSTLLAMVASFAGGVERVKSIYAEAMACGYRFYSYGDAMLVVARPSGEQARAIT